MILLNPTFKKSRRPNVPAYTMYFGPDFVFKDGIKNKNLDGV